MGEASRCGRGPGVRPWRPHRVESLAPRPPPRGAFLKPPSSRPRTRLAGSSNSQATDWMTMPAAAVVLAASPDRPRQSPAAQAPPRRSPDREDEVHRGQTGWPVGETAMKARWRPIFSAHLWPVKRHYGRNLVSFMLRKVGTCGLKGRRRSVFSVAPRPAHFEVRGWASQSPRVGRQRGLCASIALGPKLGSSLPSEYWSHPY